MDLIQRPRRLRGSENLRKMVRETRMDKSSLIYPLFVKEGTGIEEEIPSMEGQFRYSVDRLPFELERLLRQIFCYRSLTYIVISGLVSIAVKRLTVMAGIGESAW